MARTVGYELESNASGSTGRWTWNVRGLWGASTQNNWAYGFRLNGITRCAWFLVARKSERLSVHRVIRNNVEGKASAAASDGAAGNEPGCDWNSDFDCICAVLLAVPNYDQIGKPHIKMSDELQFVVVSNSGL